jgi:hypothetical protein
VLLQEAGDFCAYGCRVTFRICSPGGSDTLELQGLVLQGDMGVEARPRRRYQVAGNVLQRSIRTVLSPPV